MYVIVREFKVEPGNETTFESAFDPRTGSRARLFAASDAFLGSELLRGDADTTRFLAVERWRSQRAYERFGISHSEDFERLEREAAEMTSSQRLVGDFVVADEEPLLSSPGGVSRPN